MVRRLSSLTLVLVAAGVVGGCSKPARRPHVILITADALRADHLSIHGYARETSPRLDAFARSSWQFLDAITVIPKTGPSFATLFSGRHPREHGVGHNAPAIPDELPLLAERLRALGYRTAAFVSNPALRGRKGYARGFDTYDMVGHDAGVAAVNEAFRVWADRDWSEPTFVWLHYIDPHGPYEPPPPFDSLFIDDGLAGADRRVPLDRKRSKVLGAIPRYQIRGDEDSVTDYVARYDGEIRYVDTAFGEVIDLLRERGLFDPSVVIFTSDHGESLGEHEYYFEHGWFAYEPTLHVPLMIKTPGQSGGRIIREQVSNLDLLPTLLPLVGLPTPDVLAGADLLQPLGSRPPLLIENSDNYDDKVHGVRTSRWKFLVRVSDSAEELYDLRSDPGETDNLVARMSDTAEELRRACGESLALARERSFERHAEGGPEPPDAVEAQRALGYVD